MDKIKKIKRFFFLATLLILSAQVSVASANAYTHNSFSDYRNTNWMSSISGSKRLSELSIPGTHDSMARYGTNLAKTQSLPLDVQLNSGVRALDIRARHYYNSFTIHHGMVYQKANFDDVLVSVRQFLQANPRETILMRVREEYSPEGTSRPFEDTFAAYKKLYSGLFWDYSSNNPTLDQIRGKIVILQDFSARQKYGISWDVLNTQDEWGSLNMWNLYNKWLSIKNHLHKATYGDKNTIFVNFLSGGAGPFPYFAASGKVHNSDSAPLMLTGYITPLHNNFYPDFPRVACFWKFCAIAFQGTNILTSDRLTSYGRVGIIYADFPGKTLLQKIIGRNF